MGKLFDLNTHEFRVAELKEAGFTPKPGATVALLDDILSSPSISRTAVKPPATNHLKFQVGDLNENQEGLFLETPPNLQPTDRYYALSKDISYRLGSDLTTFLSNITLDKARKLIKRGATSDEFAMIDSALISRKSTGNLLRYPAPGSWASKGNLFGGRISAAAGRGSRKYLSNPLCAGDEVDIEAIPGHDTVLKIPVSLPARDFVVSMYAKSSHPTELYGMYIMDGNLTDTWLINEGSYIYSSKNSTKAIINMSFTTYPFKLDSEWKYTYKYNKNSQAKNCFLVICWPEHSADGQLQDRSGVLKLAGLQLETSSIPSEYDSRYVQFDEHPALPSKDHPILIDLGIQDNNTDWCVIYERKIESNKLAKADSFAVDSFGASSNTSTVYWGYQSSNIVASHYSTKPSEPINLEDFYGWWETVVVEPLNNTQIKITVTSSCPGNPSYSITSECTSYKLQDGSNKYNLLLGGSFDALKPSPVIKLSNGEYKNLIVTTKANKDMYLKTWFNLSVKNVDNQPNLLLKTKRLKEI